MLDSNIADIVNNTTEPIGGAIAAALFLQEFLPKHQAWVHIDVMGWNLRNRPGRRISGEAMGMRALYSYLEKHYPPNEMLIHYLLVKSVICIA